MVAKTVSLVNGILKASHYPEEHWGGYYHNGELIFCEREDFTNPDPKLLALTDSPIKLITTSPVVAGEEFFGTHFNKRANDSNSAINLKTVRSHDMDGGLGMWRGIQTTSSQNTTTWNWSALDSWVNTHYSKGRDLVYTIFGTPNWASSDKTEIGAYGQYSPGIQAEPEDFATWDYFCQKVAERYYGKIKYYEIWNEPNIYNDGTGVTSKGTETQGFFWSGTYAHLSEMTRRANQVIKSVDPTAKIISSPITVWAELGKTITHFDARGFLIDMLNTPTGDGSTVMKDWVDIIGVHLYFSGGGQALPGMIDNVFDAMNVAGVSSKEVWDTESAQTMSSASQYNDAQMSKLMARSMLIMAAKGINRTIYYQFDNGDYGFVNRSSLVSENWNATRELILSGAIIGLNQLYDGRVVYGTQSGTVII